MHVQPPMTPIPPSWVNHYSGKVAVVLGNGPSLRDYDLTDPFFTENITFGSNSIGLCFFPTFYFVGDPTAWSKNKDRIANARKAGSRIVVSSFVKDKCKGVPRSATIIRYESRDNVGTPEKGGRLYHGRTSGVVMTHLAYQMGFSYIFLLGVDGYYVAGPSHFYPTSVKRSTSDWVARNNFALIYNQLRRDGGYLLDLSQRSVFDSVIPKWHQIGTD